jgi:hypothetical protein
MVAMIQMERDVKRFESCMIIMVCWKFQWKKKIITQSFWLLIGDRWWIGCKLGDATDIQEKNFWFQWERELFYTISNYLIEPEFLVKCKSRSGFSEDEVPYSSFMPSFMPSVIIGEDSHVKVRLCRADLSWDDNPPREGNRMRLWNISPVGPAARLSFTYSLK